MISQTEVQAALDLDLRVLEQAENYLDMQLSQVRPFIGQGVLEIGAGIGNHTEQFFEMGAKRVVAFEYDKNFCNRMEVKFGSRVKVVHGDLNQVDCSESELKDAGIDTVVGINTLEHVEHDLKCLRDLAAILPKSGKIVLIVPAFQILFAPLDKKYGHFRRYTKKDFESYAAALNLKLIKNNYFNPVGWFGWFLMAKILRTVKINQTPMKAFNWILPLLNRIESLFPNPPIGLSLIGVFEK